MSQISHGSSRGMGHVDGGPVTAVAGFVLLINLFGLYAFTGVAICVFGYIGLTLFVSSRASRDAKNPRSAEIGTGFIIASWCVALIGGVLVGAFHAVDYKHAAYAVLAVYTVAVLIWLIGRAFTALWSWLFSLAGLAMIAAVVQLNPPPGADDMEKSESWTPVDVTVVDEGGKPIDGAVVYLDLLHFWQGEPELEGDREWWTKGTTSDDGTARMSLEEDPRFKRLLIRVRCEPFARGWNEPTTIGGYVGFSDARMQVILPDPKIPYSFHLVMSQRPHPDSAMLALEVRRVAETESVVSRGIKLAVTADDDLSRYSNGQTLNEDEVNRRGLLRDVYLSGNAHRSVFKLDRNLAGRPLTFWVLEHRWINSEESIRVLKRIDLSAIPLGEDYTIPPITLVDGDFGTPVVAGRPDQSDRR